MKLRRIVKFYFGPPGADMPWEYDTALAMLTQMGLSLDGEYSPVWCEVCGVCLEYQELTDKTLAPEGKFIYLSEGGMFIAQKCGLGVVLRVDDFVRGEATFWGEGLGGECNCVWED